MVCKIYERIKAYENLWEDKKKIIFMVKKRKEKREMRINDTIPNYCQ